MENLLQHDGELILLGRFLDKVASEAEANIDAIPAEASVDDECAMIDAASMPVYVIAEHIVALAAQGKRGEAIKVRAQAWLDGTYWSEVA
ncbi:hypothetical protein [Sinorhizobium meliloti]|uniref:hypothetical protein n=1 Tax=Rhizobium meliloti TaxID=382 RepID=UPI0004A2E928|nr:hypothetical protein [Sinorhizobium meliloti]ARS70120.1 hypothetical protein SMRU11_24010 [Sinorhizobium meliloti RU11/001]